MFSTVDGFKDHSEVEVVALLMHKISSLFFELQSKLDQLKKLTSLQIHSNTHTHNNNNHCLSSAHSLFRLLVKYFYY